MNGKPINKAYGPRYGTLDSIGCGVTGKRQVYFTYNGVALPLIETNFWGPLFPLISLRGSFA